MLRRPKIQSTILAGMLSVALFGSGPRALASCDQPQQEVPAVAWAQIPTYAYRWAQTRARECWWLPDPRWTTRCSTALLDRLTATASALDDPGLSAGLDRESIVAALPDPVHCLDMPHDAAYAIGGIFELVLADHELEHLLLDQHQLDVAGRRLADYQMLAKGQNSLWHQTRAMYWRGVYHRLAGDTNEAIDALSMGQRQAYAFDAGRLEGDLLLELATIALDQGEVAVAQERLSLARVAYATHDPSGIPEVLRLAGFVAFEDGEPARGLALLEEAVLLREIQHEHATHGRSRAALSRALESLARGLLFAKRPDEAVVIALRSLSLAELDSGPCPRARSLRHLVLSAQFAAERYDDAYRLSGVLLESAATRPDFFRDAVWLAERFAEGEQPDRALELLGDAEAVASQEGHDDWEAALALEIDALRARISDP